MNFGISILGIFCIFGGIGIAIVNRVSSKKKIIGNPYLLIAGMALFVLANSFTIIPTGNTGVRTTFGQIDEATVPTGFNWKIPFVQKISLVNNKQQDLTFDTQIWSETKERTAIYYSDVTVTYQINPEKSAWIYANVSDYQNGLVQQNIVSSAIKSSSKVLSDVDATNRSMIEPLVLENLQASLNEKYGENTIIVNKVVISNTDFEESYNQAIANKQQAQLEAEQQAIINQQNVDKAEADAKVLLTEAQAKADAKMIEAQAEADANKLLEESLTNSILQEMYINKWDGVMPSVLTGDDTGFMFNVDTGNNATRTNTPASTQQSTEE